MGRGTRRDIVAAVWAMGLTFICVLLAGSPAQAAPAPPRFFGISAFEPPTQQEFDRMGRAGIWSFRLPIEWRAVQPQQGGPFTFAAYDDLIGRAARSGLEVVPLIYGSPEYINPRLDDPPLNSPQQRRQYATFVKALVQRYGRGGSYWAENPTLPARPARWWVAWNEPNLKAWWYPKPQPKRYVKLLQLTRSAVLSADPSARLVTAGIYRLPAARFGSPMTKYLRQLYRVRGFKKATDAVAIHIFAPKPPQVLRTATQAREIMNAAGDRRAQLWINELAWATAGDAPFFRTSRAGQARRLTRSYRLLLQSRRRLRLKRVFWLAFRDTDSGPASWIQHTGLNDSAGNPKPAWFALARTAGGTP